jgi:nitrate/TMAO reductase-like tetraheme cytochrome c subunit
MSMETTVYTYRCRCCSHEWEEYDKNDSLKCSWCHGTAFMLDSRTTPDFYGFLERMAKE